MALKTLPRHTRVVRAGIYCRLSYAPDGSEEKVERQEGDCRELAGRLRWEVSERHIFRDNSRSAWQRNRRRPAWDLMLKAIEAGEIDAVIIYHGDRLIRQPFDLERLIGIADQKGIRIAAPSGTRDLDSPDDRFILRIEAAQACRESDNTSRRVKRGVAAMKKKGRVQSGGRRAFGWGLPTGVMRVKVDPETGEEREVPVLDHNKGVPEELKLLVDVAKRVHAGMSKRAAVRWMNERCRTTTGGLWSEMTLTRVLVAPRIAGLVEHAGEYYKAVWDPAISRELWEDLVVLVGPSERQGNRGVARTARTHLLTGVGECPVCHVPAEGISATCQVGIRNCEHKHVKFGAKPVNRGGRRSRIYYCTVCTRGRNEAYMDAYVEGHVVRLLNSPDLLTELRETQAKATPGIATEIAALEGRRKRLKEEIDAVADDPDIDPVLSMRSIASYSRKIAELRGQLATSARQRAVESVIGYTRDQWASECVDVRSGIVQSLYRVVMLSAKLGPGFDPDSVLLIRRPLAEA
ncbi:recombinase family protein [Streptomyces sp. NPDC091212]|uniref:recombinase family protein n=1 Tax=Streptomyces sp. NPDC091212 TaxID=3155191 RepID=UPI003440B5DB